MEELLLAGLPEAFSRLSTLGLPRAQTICAAMVFNTPPPQPEEWSPLQLASTVYAMQARNPGLIHLEHSLLSRSHFIAIDGGDGHAHMKGQPEW